MNKQQYSFINKLGLLIIFEINKMLVSKVFVKDSNKKLHLIFDKLDLSIKDAKQKFNNFDIEVADFDEYEKNSFGNDKDDYRLYMRE